jgi:hypothetical protein
VRLKRTEWLPLLSLCTASPTAHLAPSVLFLLTGAGAPPASQSAEHRGQGRGDHAGFSTVVSPRALKSDHWYQPRSLCCSQDPGEHHDLGLWGYSCGMLQRWGATMGASAPLGPPSQLPPHPCVRPEDLSFTPHRCPGISPPTTLLVAQLIP